MNLRVVSEEKKGKCFSKVNQGQRKKSDLYETPYSMTRAYLNWYNLSSKFVLEPACGNGAIIKVLDEFGIRNVDYDISTGHDFLETSDKYEWIVTNPPYTLAGKFIDKCMDVTADGFSLLLPLNYLQGQGRYESYYRTDPDRKFGLVHISIFTRMPDLSYPLREDGKIQKTGMQSYAWYTWEKRYTGPPIVSWLDIKNCIARKGDR